MSTVVLTNVQTLLGFYQFFPLLFFLCFRIPSRLLHCISFSCLLSLCNLPGFSVCLVFHGLDSFEEQQSGFFVDCPSFQVRLVLSHNQMMVIDVWERYHRGEVCNSSHDSKRNMISVCLIIGDIYFDPWLRWCLPGFPAVKLLCFFLLHTLLEVSY